MLIENKKLFKNEIFVSHLAVGDAQPRLTAVAGIPTGRFWRYKGS
jgi:hypothetical protein